MLRHTFVQWTVVCALRPLQTGSKQKSSLAVNWAAVGSVVQVNIERGNGRAAMDFSEVSYRMWLRYGLQTERRNVRNEYVNGTVVDL